METPSRIRSFPIDPAITEARRKKLEDARKRNAKRDTRKQSLLRTWFTKNA